jgi:signal transduction histidine kinase
MQWLLADLHIHSTFSDGSVQIEEIIKTYGEAGFDVIAITDHLFDTQSPISLRLREEGKSVKDVETYFHKIEEVSLWAKESYDLPVIPGLEICNLLEDYHILGIDLKEAVNPNQDATGVIDDIHRQGGLAIASHPHLKLSYFLKGDNESIQRHPLHLWKHRERYVDKIDAWEIANREDLFGIVSLEGLPYVANSDFHDRGHLSSWKSLIFAEKDKEAVKKAIPERKLSLFFFNENGAKNELPRIETPKENDRSSDGSAHAGSEKILIVDDEKDLVDLVAYNLKGKGYQTLTAYNGFEAWEKIQSEKPEVMILDLMMPELDGWELCRIIRRHDNEAIRGISILMLSARAMPEDRIHGLQVGADDYLTKPFSVNELILRVEKLMEKRRIMGNLRGEMELLRSTTQEKEASLRNVVHDLKNPLISVGASAKRMLRKNQTEEDLKILRIIYDNSIRLTRWVDEALLPAGLSSQKIEEEMKDVLIQSVVERAVDSIKDAAAEKRIEVRFWASSSIPRIPCHEDWILRAIENLLANALKYTPEGGRIEVTVTSYLEWKEGGVVEIRVKDTGIGILEEDTGKIFEPFYRGKNARTEPGIGLGLSFVKEAAELHGGKVLVLSEPAKGSTFSILLPVGEKRKGKEGERELTKT